MFCVCPNCRRHTRLAAGPCPFCAAGPAVAVVAGLALSAHGCKPSPQNSTYAPEAAPRETRPESVAAVYGPPPHARDRGFAEAGSDAPATRDDWTIDTNEADGGASRFRGLADLADAGGNVAVDPAPSSAARAPVEMKVIGEVKVTRGNVSNAARILAGMRAGQRACYQRSLADDPNQKGRVQLTIQVGANGEVTSVSVQPEKGAVLSRPVLECLKTRAQLAQFEPPEGAPAATVSVVLDFRPAR